MSHPSDTTAQTAGTIKCNSCGANLKFSPGVQNLNCEYCNSVNEIEQQEALVIENDFYEYLRKSEEGSEKQTISTVACGSCGAATTLQPNVTACNCPYCDTPLVIKNASTCSVIKPKYLLPFKIERHQAKEGFVKWVGGLWFAPNKLKDYAQHSAERLRGVYMPYWTYDASTVTSYTGQRGTYYYTTETYEDSNGKTKTRRVRETDWDYVSGTVNNSFDDVLVCASHSLPDKLVNALEPWDLNGLKDYRDDYLAGFVTESYQTKLREGFEQAKQRIEPAIKSSIVRDIGGDDQKVDSFDTDYNNITFKHILLPLWISAYRYNEKVYRFTINARTGEVQGERPYSFWKIFFFTVTILGIIGGIIWYFADE